ncbi:MAG: hypothetical protein EBU52_00195 [Cytophagia bacterium]|nr:hypothetical protein [Cytophagia bacterium]
MREGEVTTVDNLIKEWEEILKFYDGLIENNFKLRPIRFIVRHIIEKGYNQVLFPGTSLYSLLISIPRDKRINYDRTLQVRVDELRNILKFTFTDHTGLDRSTAQRHQYLKWEETCQLTEGIALFESFLTENIDFKGTTKQRQTVD